MLAEPWGDWIVYLTEDVRKMSRKHLTLILSQYHHHIHPMIGATLEAPQPVQAGWLGQIAKKAERMWLGLETAD